MDRSKVVAVITGAIALILGFAYLAVVQFLDFRGEMLPAPIDLPGMVIPSHGSHISSLYSLEHNVYANFFQICNV